jgi:hypothetical protein
MNIGRYAPSAQFTGIALSVLLSAGLVYGAERYTHPPVATAQVESEQTPAQASDAANWEAALYSIQAANASSSFGAAPNQDTVGAMLQAAQSNNITDTVGKTLLINLSSAKSQGLGDDTPTQDQIISAATAQIAATKPSLYTSADLTVVPDSNAALRAYGNAVMQILNNNPAASEEATMQAIADATNKNDASQLQRLTPMAAANKTIAMQLLALPVPKTLSPLHLTVINSFATIAAAYPDIQAMFKDPLRGIVGLQTHQTQVQQLGRVFTNIAQSLNKDGILFTKDEPGSAWQYFITSS